VRWLRRRLTLVRATLAAVVVTLLPEVCGHNTRLGAVQQRPSKPIRRVTLRRRGAAAVVKAVN
jgi:hypothetical protein